MNIMLHLVPPPEFRSGMYEATIEGKTTVGRVECTSLTYLWAVRQTSSAWAAFSY